MLPQIEILPSHKERGQSCYNTAMKHFYSKKALTNAKNLRSNQTEFEDILWQYIRAKRLNGIKFRRQVPIGKYIVDFVALSKKFIIELDGSQHLDVKNLEYDKIRTEYLKEKGYTVLRILNNDISNDIDTVLNHIVDEYNKIE